MNLSTIALMILCWQVMSNSKNTQSNPSPRGKVDFTDFLSDDTKCILNCVDKLSNSSSNEDRTSAIFQMMSNPTVMNIASNLFTNNGQSNTTDKGEKAHDNPSTHAPNKDEHTNSEGYRFETPSATSQEFFRQINDIADTEVKHKLYWFYDNWYIK